MTLPRLGQPMYYFRCFVGKRWRKSRLVSFPDYATSIGEEIARALAGEREYGPDVMQLLYVANRYERKPDIQRWLEGGLILVCDRYTASSVAFHRSPSFVNPIAPCSDVAVASVAYSNILLTAWPPAPGACASGEVWMISVSL